MDSITQENEIPVAIDLDWWTRCQFGSAIDRKCIGPPMAHHLAHVIFEPIDETIWFSCFLALAVLPLWLIGSIAGAFVFRAFALFPLLLAAGLWR